MQWAVNSHLNNSETNLTFIHQTQTFQLSVVLVNQWKKAAEDESSCLGYFRTQGHIKATISCQCFSTRDIHRNKAQPFNRVEIIWNCSNQLWGKTVSMYNDRTFLLLRDRFKSKNTYVLHKLYVMTVGLRSVCDHLSCSKYGT